MKKIFEVRSPAIVRRLGDWLRGEQDMGRARVGDVAFTYRMGAGFAGDVNRTHPFSVNPSLINTTSPPLGYGLAVVNASDGTNSVRQVAAGDTALTYLSGVTVRPYPTQQSSGGMSSPFGSVAPPVSGVIDVLKQGYIMVYANPTGGAAAVKGGQVFVWCAASSGSHVQGAFETAATGGSTITLPVALAEFNGPGDANGITEVIFKND